MSLVSKAENMLSVSESRWEMEFVGAELSWFSTVLILVGIVGI